MKINISIGSKGKGTKGMKTNHQYSPENGINKKVFFSKFDDNIICTFLAKACLVCVALHSVLEQI